MKEKGLYAQIASYIRENKRDIAVINAEDLLDATENKISLDGIPSKEKDKFIMSFILRVVLNQLGYRSIVRRKKIYVNPELMDLKDLGTIIGNIDNDIDARTAIRNKLEELEGICDGQLKLPLNSDYSGYEEEITTEDLFSTLLEKYGI